MLKSVEVGVTSAKDGSYVSIRLQGNYRVQKVGIGDLDGDGMENGRDNCPRVANAGQANTDGDAGGNDCDTDDDNDGLSDAAEQVADTPAAHRRDSLAAQPEGLARLGAGRDLHGHRTGQGRHLHLAAQDGEALIAAFAMQNVIPGFSALSSPERLLHFQISL